MSKNLFWVCVVLWMGVAVPGWGATYEITGNHGTSTTDYEKLADAIKPNTLAIGDTIRITGGTSFWDSPYILTTGATSMNDRVTTEVTGGIALFR